jgi:hypothetical protein
MNKPTPLLFHASGQPGTSVLKNYPGHIRAKKRTILVQVSFSGTDSLVHTLEGEVHVHANDAIVTGGQGEQWPVPLVHFADKYRPASGVEQGSDGNYVTLPIEVLALLLHTEFTVILADGRSRLLGGAGDWLVDYGDGTLGIVAPAIFNATYDIMEAD